MHMYFIKHLRFPRFTKFGTSALLFDNRKQNHYDLRQFVVLSLTKIGKSSSTVLTHNVYKKVDILNNIYIIYRIFPFASSSHSAIKVN